jgi:hypothetical protein
MQGREAQKCECLKNGFKNIKFMKKLGKNIKFILAVIFIAGSVVNGIIITLYNVDKSANLNDISKKLAETKSSINSLNESVSASDSLVNFMDKSSDSGFTDHPQVLYFSQSDSLAQLR